MNDLLLTLAAWRLSTLLIRERGPYAVLEYLRSHLGIQETTIAHEIDGRVVLTMQQEANTELARLFLCLWCLSLWVGLALARGDWLKALAYSAGAIVIESYVDKNKNPADPE